MDTKLDSLAPIFRFHAMELLARAIEKNILVKVINTLRTQDEQRLFLSQGHSWVPHSKHEDGLAIDICPWAIWNIHGANKLNWDPNDPIWNELGAIGESLGLNWGGRWKQKDLGHFEWKG